MSQQVVNDIMTDNHASGALLEPQGPTVEQVTQILRDVMESMGLLPNLDNFTAIALQLSDIAHKAPPWGGRYIHSVYHQHKGVTPSPALAHAILALAQALDETPPGVAGAEWVKVLAYPGQVPEGALVPASAEVARCARPGCPVLFIKINPLQRYHDKACAQSAARARRKRVSSK